MKAQLSPFLSFTPQKTTKNVVDSGHLRHTANKMQDNNALNRNKLWTPKKETIRIEQEQSFAKVNGFKQQPFFSIDYSDIEFRSNTFIDQSFLPKKNKKNERQNLTKELQQIYAGKFKIPRLC